MCLVIFDAVSKPIHELVNQLIELDKAGFEGLESIQIGLLEQLVVKIMHRHFIDELFPKGIAALLQGLDSLERLIDLSLEDLKAQLVIRQPLILLYVAGLDILDAFEEISPVLRIPHIVDVERYIDLAGVLAEPINPIRELVDLPLQIIAALFNAGESLVY